MADEKAVLSVALETLVDLCDPKYLNDTRLSAAIALADACLRYDQLHRAGPRPGKKG